VSITRHPETDVVTMGAGWTAGILAQQLTARGTNVVSLERGPERWTDPDFQHNHDSLHYRQRKAMMLDISKETWTWRPDPATQALPLRRYGSFHPGHGIGGAGVHWAAETWRFYPSDFRYRSHHVERYGAGSIPAGATVQDWPISYEELEPYYDRYEHDVGVSGDAGNVRGEIRERGNPFEGPRAREYPLPPLAPSLGAMRFASAAREIGLHPFRQPSSILSQAYTDLSGRPRSGCLYCGFCTRYGCEVDAKASAVVSHIPMALETGRYEIRTGCTVKRVEMDDRGRAVGLVYADPSGQEHLQPAAVIVLSGYTLNNVRMMLLSRNSAHPDGLGNDRGLVGSNYTYQLVQSPVSMRFEGERFNQYMGNACVADALHDFEADNFDHSGLGFIGGASMTCGAGEREPLTSVGSLPMGDGRNWGAPWKRALREWDSYFGIGIQGESLPYPEHRLDLDPRYTDVYGQPLLRITYDFRENDYRLYEYLAQRCAEIARAMNPTEMSVTDELEPYSIAPYQSTHNTGGAIMGDQPDNSVTDSYGRVWDTPNVFVTGATLYPQNPGMNPTETLCALAYRTADYLNETDLGSLGDAFA
jgi:gluconate 2-dehydrogenase alpha chain